MTKEDLESTPVSEELTEPVVPEISDQEPEVEPTSSPEGLTEARLKELLDAQRKALEEEFEERMKRVAQSTKDRRIGKLETKLDELLVAREQGLTLDDLIKEQSETQTLESRIDAILATKLSQPTRATGETWQEEWARESQKVLDKAKKRGVEVTKEEYNKAMFNNGQPFNSKGDAYAALNDLIVAKAKGESISVSAVATEGGDVASPPPPPASPKSLAEQFEEAKAKGDYAAMEKIQDQSWEDWEKMRQKEIAKAQLAQSGISPEELLEK